MKIVVGCPFSLFSPHWASVTGDSELVLSALEGTAWESTHPVYYVQRALGSPWTYTLPELVGFE